MSKKLKQRLWSKEDCQCCSIDRMSVLPDELLLSILSHLSFKEVTATSILSPRWRHLWTFAGSLDFDGMKSLSKVNYRRSGMLDEARLDYVRWVGRIISLHKESTLDEFRVLFNLNRTYTKMIDGWIRYALSRKVQRLDLNLKNDYQGKGPAPTDFYTFPYQLLCKNLNDAKYLKKLSMKYVNVNGEALEFILCNCPFLEGLSVSYSLKLTTLKITGPFPALKLLEISFCFNLSSLEICDVNLVYFIYKGSNIQLHLKNVPLLVNVTIGGIVTQHMDCFLKFLSRDLPKMETLTLDCSVMCPWMNKIPDVKMINLKKLVVRTRMLHYCTLLQPTDFIWLSPCLQIFVLQVLHDSPNNFEREVRKIVRPYAQLKVVKFMGYRGLKRDMEFIMHLLENATSLEKIEIDPRLPSFPSNDAYLYDGTYRDEPFINEIEARTCAKEQLTKNKIPDVKMINLKKLVVRTRMLHYCTLLHPTDFIWLSPCLQVFVLQVLHDSPNNFKREVRKIVRPYAQLKVVKFMGYRGLKRDMEFIMHLLENSTSLEKIEIDPRLPSFPSFDAHLYDGVVRDEPFINEIEARTCAKEQLTKVVPPNITLNIL